MDDDDDPIVQRPDETRIQPPPSRPVPPLTDPDAVHVVHEAERVRVLPDADEVNVMHEEERVRVLPDGTVIRERDRIEQGQSWFRRYLPWILIAILGLLIIAGLVLWYVTKSDTKTVPTVVGLRSDAAVNRLQNDGLKVQIVPQSSTRPAGVVFGQNPAGGASVSKGTTVRLLVSKGRSLVTVPNAVGLSQVDARNKLVNAGFAVITAQVPSDQPVGTVTAQDPPAGTRVAPGTKVHINVSKGKAVVPVPSEVGNTLSNAQGRARGEGLQGRDDARAVELAGGYRRLPESRRWFGPEGLDRPAQRLAGAVDDHDHSDSHDAHDDGHDAHDDDHDAHDDDHDEHHGHGHDTLDEHLGGGPV